MRFWSLIRNFGNRFVLNDTETIVLADGEADNPHGGFDILFTNGSLHVTVTNSKYKWKCDYPWGLNQWMQFTLSWYINLWFDVHINGQHMGSCRKVSRREYMNQSFPVPTFWEIKWGAPLQLKTMTNYADDVGVIMTDIRVYDRAMEHVYNGEVIADLIGEL